jgi:diguanylate cyclase (GGDEF)-like protein
MNLKCPKGMSIKPLMTLQTTSRQAVRPLLDFLPRGHTLSEDAWRVRHRMLSWLLRVHVAAIFCYALVRGYTLGAAVGFASIVAVFAVLACTDSRRRSLVSAMTALGLVTSSAVLVDLSGGLIEMHFHFFVMVGLLTLYQDWLPFLIAVGFVLLHHGLLGTIDPAAVYDHADALRNPLEWALIHAAFLLAASAASIVAWKMNEEHAFRDPLTHLPNRALFQDRLSHALARTERQVGVLAVLFIDLDGFKNVNDGLGHAAGDQLLCSVAERLLACVRAADTVARLGGDEFAVVLEDISGRERAHELARRIIDSLAMPFTIGGSEQTIGASVGVAFNDQGDDVDSLLRNADVAMYTVKSTGRGRYEVFAPDMHARIVDRVALERELAQAVEAGQLVLHYQPLISLATGLCFGVEALVRWQHPTRGLLAPAEFIHVAEETGAIIPIGKWVTHEACRQARRWQQGLAGEHLTVSVNLSPVQLSDPGVVEMIQTALTSTGLDPGSLVLELTESLMLKDTELNTRRLHELKDLGVSLAIDDFGTGYSSLNYLRQLPVDVLKIDKSFIDRITEGPTDLAVVEAIVNLAHAFGLTTVAEGVERPEQVDALSRLGCPLVQGFVFARPLPGPEVERHLESGRINPSWLDLSQAASLTT